MADKYLYQDGGVLKEKEAITQSTGAADAGKIPALDSTGKLDSSMLPTGSGEDTKVVPAYEDLNAGDFVNFFDDSGTVKVRKADASTQGKTADGFVLAAVTAGNNATVYLSGTNTQLSGLSGGSYYYLSATTPGGVSATAPTGSGQVVQRLGKAVSDTEISFHPGEPIVLA